MNKRIALMGISGAGKDFIADHLIKKHDFHRFSFSDQLKKIAVNIYPWLKEDYPPLIKEDPLNIKLSTGEKIEKSPRQIWMHLDKLKDVEKNIFIRMLQEDITKTGLIDEKILISDIRSKDEFLWCRENKFKIIHIYPEKKVYQEYKVDEGIEKMASLADFCFINNFNGINEFELFFETNVG